jgi:hypothetical protein
MSEPLRPAYIREQRKLAARTGAELLYPGSQRLASAIDEDV